MGSYSRALKGTAATAELWGAVYLMLAFALGERSFHAWQRLGGMPANWQDGLVVGVHLLVCPVPLLIGILFQRLLKQEENCDYCWNLPWKTTAKVQSQPSHEMMAQSKVVRGFVRVELSRCSLQSLT